MATETNLQVGELLPPYRSIVNNRQPRMDFRTEIAFRLASVPGVKAVYATEYDRGQILFVWTVVDERDHDLYSKIYKQEKEIISSNENVQFDFTVLPSHGQEENDSYIEEWPFPPSISVPIWHLHESLAKLEWLTEAWPRIAFGSSGEWIDIGTTRWWGRISEAMEVAADKDGHPKVKLHGLRQMDPEVFSIIPYASVDSTNVARNIGIDKAWTGSYIPRRRETRAMLLRDNIQNHASSARWPGLGGIPRNLELYG
jgi:hypothetical protein